MRPPRYRFPDEVRTATSEMALRMIDEGEITETPEELDAWIDAHPHVRESLARGGYGTMFDAHDLFPLLQSNIARAGGPVAGAAPAATAANGRGLLVILLVLVAVVILVLLLVGI